jgi:outer membrane protein OmpA-like peptidoglycan-associated protein
LEADAAVRLAFPWGLSVTAGGGAGIVKAVGSPLFRVFLSLRWAPERTDSDKDGVPDYKDKCPDQKEDRDGFEDGDGCPDNDNDNDYIPDNRDECPDQAEDKDGYKDDDGCPDLDNDGDGVPDKEDNCPMHKGPAKHSGCPADMLDRDGDGIPDGKDKCPEKAEDKDGVEDGDGCPDPDNDKDGVCDALPMIQDNLDSYSDVCKGKDQCPSDPEDRDGYKDDDGCPDPDNDGDGFCDDNPVIQKNVSKYASQCIAKDACPDKPETINGNEDTDGCPDEGTPDVKIGQKQIQLRRNIQFRRTSDRFESPSRKILQQIVLHLRFKLDSFKKLVVVGFVEPQMRSSKAKRVSQAWADKVKAYLVKLGIPEDKIISKGLGGKKPVYTGSSRRRSRRRNRRVEFYLVR